MSNVLLIETTAGLRLIQDIEYAMKSVKIIRLIRQAGFMLQKVDAKMTLSIAHTIQ